jgi:nucleotide-binding universal stress UspA family protein
MKILIGIDPEEQYRDALALLARLRFAQAGIVLAHAQEPILSPLFAASEMLYYGDNGLEAKLREAGTRLLRDAEYEARSFGLDVGLETFYQVGSKAGVLMDLATDRGLDLVAIGSGKKGALESFFTGSVGRALAADCEQSFLVARGDRERRGPVRTVFATDLSDYSDRCLDRFIDMAPEGVGEITVLTATELDEASDLVRQFGYGGDFDVVSEESSRVSNLVGQSMVERLTSHGYRATFEWEDGYPYEALPTAMKRTGADLLVLGAKGHSFIERLLQGSVSYHEATAEPYSVMVLRTYPEKSL